MKKCPNCQSECKDFDLNIVALDQFRLIRKIVNTKDSNLSFEEIGHLTWSLLWDQDVTE